MSCCAIAGAKHTVMIAEHHRNVAAFRAGTAYAGADAYVKCLAKAIVKTYAYAYAYAIAAADCYGSHQAVSADVIIAAYVDADFSTTERCYSKVSATTVGAACATAFATGTAGAVRTVAKLPLRVRMKTKCMHVC
jgi:hypothetical protein